jgi:ankyrin repeat protein
MRHVSTISLCLAGICGLLLASVTLPAAAPQKNPFLDQAGAQWELLNTYCFKCHNSTVKAGGVAMDKVRPEDVPQTAGKDFQFPQILKPLEPFKDQLTIVSGLRNKPADSTSPHAITAGTWLNCVKPAVGQSAKAGISADQIAAQHIGQDTPFPSLELSTEAGGPCDPSFGCGYGYTISFRTPTQPLPMEYNPRKIFYQLFGQGLPDPDRTTPLVLALLNMHFDTAAYLISAGADVDKWDLYGRTPLYAAVDLSTLPRGGRPDIPSSDETTALDVIKLLLDRGANPNSQLKLRPPYRNVIFDRGSDNAVLTIGATPLLRASKAGDNPEAMRLLLERGALVDLPNVDGITPLMTAAGMGHTASASRGKFNTEADSITAIPLLLKAGADVNARASDGQTPLHSAAQKGWNKVVTLLVENGADLNAKDNRGRTALDYAKGNSGGGRGQAAPANPETAAVLEKLLLKRP